MKLEMTSKIMFDFAKIQSLDKNMIKSKENSIKIIYYMLEYNKNSS